MSSMTRRRWSWVLCRRQSPPLLPSCLLLLLPHIHLRYIHLYVCTGCVINDSFLLPQPPPFPPVGSHKSQCFSCSSAATEHCITLLKAFALKPQTRRQLVLRKLIQELVDFNLRSGSPQMQQKIRELLCIVSRDDETATAELNKYVSDRVLEHITPSRVTPTLVRAIRVSELLHIV